jgi:thioredoxin 1
VVLEVTEREFPYEIQRGVAVVDFFAPWCQPCRVVAPILEEVEKLYRKVNFVKVDVDACSSFIDSLKLKSVPTVVIFRDGLEVVRLLGLLDKAKYQAALDDVLAG